MWILKNYAGIHMNMKTDIGQMFIKQVGYEKLLPVLYPSR